MNDNLQPLGDDHLEARITAYVLGESSPFEAAEIESLIEKSPELKLFLNRTRTLHTLLAEAETTSNSSSEEWKLPSEKREKLNTILGSTATPIQSVSSFQRDSRIRRASFRAAIGIAACFVVTFIISRLYVFPKISANKESAMIVSYMAKEDNAVSPEADIAQLRRAVREQEDKVEEARKTLTTISRTKDISFRSNTGRGELDEGAGAIAALARKESKESALERSIDTGDYIDAKQDFETDLARLEQLKLKLITEEIAAELPAEKMEIADNRRDSDSLRRKPQAPSASMAKKAIASNTISPIQIPVPDLALVDPSQDFGDGEDMGAGWGGGGAPPAPGKAPSFAAAEAAPQINIGGQVETAGPQEFKKGMTLGDAVASAGGATVFGSTKRVRVYRDGKAQTYDLTDESLAGIELQPNDTIEMPQKNWMGCGASRDDVTKSLAEGKQSAGSDADPLADEASGAALALRGLRSGDAPVNRDSIDAILNNPDRPDARLRAETSLPAPSAKPSAPMSELAQREIGRRQEALSEADKKLIGGREDYSKGDYSGAVAKYREALEKLPEAPATENRRQSYTEHLKDASIAQAQEFRKVGKYDEARELLKQAEASAPADADVKKELEYLDDPIRTNPALSTEHAKDVDEVRRKLYMAQGNYDLGKFDDAKTAYEETLRIDPYNSAARRGMEKIAAAKSDYYRAAYDHTRAELLMEVDNAWELSVPADKQFTGAWNSFSNGSGDGKDLAKNEIELDVPPLTEELEGFINYGSPILKPGSTIDAPKQVDVVTKSASGEKSAFAWWVGDESSKTTSKDSNGGFEGEIHTGNAGEYLFRGMDLSDSSLFSGNFDSDELDLYASDSGRLGSNFYFSDQISPLPGVTTRSGAASNFETVREFDYPTEFEPPELSNPRGVIVAGRESEILPVTPATPTAFESKSLGLLTEPAVGGLKRDLAEDFSVLEDDDDKVPHLGDIPIVGKLFEKPAIDLADLSQEIPANQEPFSTFSLNISDASFQIARTAVEKGERPDPESIKPEQFYNAVDYGDPAPSSLEPVSAAIDQTAHPVIPGRNLVRVGIRTASTGRSAAQPLRLTLLVDQSGSMVRADRRAAMEKALEQLATLLTENDEITVIGFSRTPRLLADSMKGNEAGKLPALINQTANEGGTNIEQAMNLASELALRHKLDGAQNRIVLFTDGAANLGNADPERLADKVKDLRQQGLAFDIAGIGADELNDNLLSELARHGNGRYYLVGENTGASLATQLAGAFRPAAENVKVQVKLNPERVGSYKLIGFEKDRLKTEDFRNDSVDAAELAADEAGVAMYQVETLPEGSGEIGEVSVRFRDTASGEMVERTWTIPYDATTPAFDKATPKTQLATLSLLAAQKLQGGPLADAISFGNLAKTIAELRQTYKADPKAQQMLNFVNALK
jgi:tetratricopeptide (TPR) repeat protein/secreted protein with Ig-like and vWFA domain